MMLIAVFVFALGHSKGKSRAWLRNPMLISVMIWAVAHLLVNGDLASLILFGGLGAWAFVDRLMINARTPDWTPKAPGTTARGHPAGRDLGRDLRGDHGDPRLARLLALPAVGRASFTRESESFSRVKIGSRY